MTRLSSLNASEIIRACAESNDGDAWEEFIARFQRAISLSVIHVARQFGNLSRQNIDDLVQETYLKLCADRCRSLSEFASRQPDLVEGYIRVTAANVVRDYFKAQVSQKRGAGHTLESLDEADRAQISDIQEGAETIERQVLLNQIDQCLTTGVAGPDEHRDRLIFWLYYRQGMSAKAIAALPRIGLTPKGVESALQRLTRLVREQIVASRSDSHTDKKTDRKGFRPAESY